MHTRQSGAAHVPIMFFLILLVIFLGTLGFAYVSFDNSNKLLLERNEARAELVKAGGFKLLAEHYIEDLGLVINKPGEYKGRERNLKDYEEAALPTGGLINPAELKTVIQNAIRGAGITEGTSLENILGSMVSTIESKNQRIRDITAERDKALADSQELNRKFNQLRNETEAKAREWAQQLDQARQDYDGHVSEKQGFIDTLTANLQAKDTKMIQDREAWDALEKELRKNIANLRNHNSALVHRDDLRQPPNSPDGKVLAAQPLVRTAFINLGKKDLLQPDTMFRIKNPGSDKVKGYARVTRVEAERAEVELSGIVDPVGDYIREGDLLYNDLYTPGLSRTFFLMGRFSAPYNKDTLARLLIRLGNKVVDRMAPGVDTVIIGNNLPTEEGDGFAPIQESDDYKLATYLGVEFAPLIKIRDLVAPTN